MAPRPASTFDPNRLRQEVLRQDLEEFKKKKSLTPDEKLRMRRLTHLYWLEVQANTSSYDHLRQKTPWGDAFMAKLGTAEQQPLFWRKLKTAIDHADAVRDECVAYGRICMAWAEEPNFDTLPPFDEWATKHYEDLRARRRVVRMRCFSTPTIFWHDNKKNTYLPYVRLLDILHFYWVELRVGPKSFFRTIWSRLRWSFILRRMKRYQAELLYLGNIRRARLASQRLSQFRMRKLAAESTTSLGREELKDMSENVKEFIDKSVAFQQQLSRLGGKPVPDHQREKLIRTNNDLASMQEKINHRHRDFVMATGSMPQRTKLAYHTMRGRLVTLVRQSGLMRLRF